MKKANWDWETGFFVIYVACVTLIRMNAEEPTLVLSLAERHVAIVGVACGQQHTGALSSDGHLWTFGLGAFGQLGHGYLHDELIPKRIEALVDIHIQIDSVKCGSFYTVAKSR